MLSCLGRIWRRRTKPMSDPSTKRRCSGVGTLATVAMLATIASIAAEAKPSSARASITRRTYTAEESKKLGDEAKRLGEAQQRIWDRKMKAVSASICRGC